MKIDSKILLNILQQWLHLKRKAESKGAFNEPPLPAELFSSDQMERYGTTLALSHELAPKSVSDMLLDRLAESESILIEASTALTEKNVTKENLTPATEWLLDNFYLIQEQIRTIRRHLPKGYGRALPQLAGTLPGYPRVYDIALKIIEHGDGRWDLENLTRFIGAYQSVTPLTLGELWAIPITLGVALIENLSSASKRIVADKNARTLADYWADKMIEMAVVDPKGLVITIADMARSNPPMSSAYIAELARRLQAAALALPLSWIEQHLAEEGLTIEHLIQQESTHQAADQATVSNSIASLRRLGEVDWRDFVEHLSLTHQILSQDPIDAYNTMDFGTRDRYRHKVERLAKKSGRTELDVATLAIRLAKEKANSFSGDAIVNPENARYCHVGYYLIDAGLKNLERALKIRHSFWEKIRNFARSWPLFSYLSSITLITFGLAYALVLRANQIGISTDWLWALGIIVAICGSQLAVALVNWIATLLIKPQRLPRMDFSKGIPEQFRTLVVVPALLSSTTEIETLTEGLEVRFLGNRDENLHFALLTDFTDAKKQHMPEDAELLKLAKELISVLNQRYSKGKNNLFFLFHRPRKWNPSEQIWMGEERKRGKLADLNNLLRDHAKDSFAWIEGDTAILSEVKYVITLDTDTQLPRDSARELVATMAHPLNRPRLDIKKLIVVEGYGILQPRIAETLSSSNSSRYVQLIGAEFGIDPYTRTVSDIYQDLFRQGSFIGKGIYDVDIFQQVLAQRFPDNHILSHDLLEGCYVRSGFLSDVPLYEKSPSSYLADAKRRSRWIRGDWQIARWILPWVMSQQHRVHNPLSLLSKVKIFDNLRRSLVPIGLILLFILSWTVLPPKLFWLEAILAILFIPPVASTLLELVRKPLEMLPKQHVATILPTIRRRAGQLILYLACLPHEAWYSFVAITRTIWRMLFSKRHLLEWATADSVNKHLRDTTWQWLLNMWMGPLATVAVTITLIMDDRLPSLLLSSPLLLLWFLSPFIARWVSKPIKHKEPKLSYEQIRFLHRMARKTWAFFDKFITAEDNWLPPDNFQEAPVEVLARRTSPTNIGMSLLASLTAYDFGYVTLTQLLERLKNTLMTMTKLERYHGHFYNWYSTETLAPLLPRYVSTVDSGNLAGHLLTLRQGLFELIERPFLNTNCLNGLADTLDILNAQGIKSLTEDLSHFQQLLNQAKHAFDHWDTILAISDALCVAAAQIANHALKTDVFSGETAEWAQTLLQQCRALQDEVKIFASMPELPTTITLRDIANLAANPQTAENDICDKAKAATILIIQLAEQAFAMAQMDMHFLYDDAAQLMTIGFNVDDQRKDSSSYDLLASEVRLGTFVAIAQGQIPQESWFALGRILVSSGGEPILISWSGSMFEYLMPLLVMPTYRGTLLDQTYHAAVSRQIAYGKHCNLPWGVSESGYNAVDTQFNYLYRAFGVPGLGLKRGLEEDLVIAPYASVMALMLAPTAACENLQRLAAEFASGKYGFYEAIDFTSSRLPPDTKRVLVRSFMTHHQGMSLLAFSYLLHDQPMQRRFSADPLFQATLLLLQERIPKPTAAYLEIPKMPLGIATASRPEALMRAFNTPNTRTPQVQLLSNGRYHVVLSQAGGGYSRWKDIALTRWREDSTCDNWGFFSYVRDTASDTFWSTIYQPKPDTTESFKVIFSEAHADFMRSDNKLDIHTEVVVSPEDDIELRRIRIHNRARFARTIEFTSYAEIVLAPQASDCAQPAFNNLFVETELLSQHHTLLATRRPQDPQQTPPWMFHRLNVYADQPYTLSFETDRTLFIGRDRNLAAPLAMLHMGELSNTTGAVLDPIMAIRCKVKLEPDALVVFDLISGVAEAREPCMALIEKYHDRSFANRIFGLAWTHGQVLLHQLNISEADAQLYGKLASALIYTSNTRRADPSILASNMRGQSGLWGYSISGDLPIVLLYIEDAVNIEIARQLIQAQQYWRRKGLAVDLVILNEEQISYRQTLQEQIMSLVSATTALSDNNGSIVVRVAEQVPLEDRILLQSVARVVLSDKNGTLKQQLTRHRVAPPVMPSLEVIRAPQNLIPEKLPPLAADTVFFNGLGGFNSAGNEYIIRLTEGAVTPAPWANVLANPNFGTLVTESGQGYTWVENAHEFRLTPWDNDPLQDSAGEAFYIRDEATGVFWSPTPLPCRGKGEYQTRHGFGYSIFEHIEEGIHSELWIYVAPEAAVKFMVLKIRNNSRRMRRLSAAGYVTWVLGDLRAKNAPYVITELSENGALLAHNPYNTEFGVRTAFLDMATSKIGVVEHSVTGDRAEFIGRNKTLQNPAALQRKRLSGRVGAGLDPCAAMHVVFDLAENQTREIIFTLGAGRDRSAAERLAERYHGTGPAQAALAAVSEYWQQMLGTVKVSTPDASVNFLANGWLLYQLLSSRLWGRSGYYQSGGAFGFRDQLQDVMALTQVAPHLLRAHLLLCAAHQFEEGDVQHWWHPPMNRGVRTRCSDDYLWLPFALCRYIEATNDRSILDEVVPFLDGRPLNAEEESYYDLAMPSNKTASIYQHAVCAIEHGLRFGVHGLPLMGSGDWNDGMNLVGKEGKGESVWLGFFLSSVLQQFAALATHYGDKTFAKRCKDEHQKLQQNIEANAWDGKWYRRAYFDDGTPLGSANNQECRIDSIAQSWSVLSGVAAPERAKQALESLYEHLVRPAEGIIQLLDPPFDKSLPNPGYIEGYVPGIRENGGQYTHGAIWAAMAFAQSDKKYIAWQLFDILNPINHGRTATEIERYKIEPYVIAADVYSVSPHTGRGGWSWYTGSAGWLYRLIIETLLGIEIQQGNQLHLHPIMPKNWDAFSVEYRFGSTTYTVSVNAVEEHGSILLDEIPLKSNIISLQDDGKTHHICLNIHSNMETN